MLKIAAISDTHSPGKNDFELFKAIKDLSKLEFDVLVLAGDIASSSELIERSLQQFSKLECKHKLFVPGNHELYSTPESNKGLISSVYELIFQQNRNNSLQIYESLKQKVTNQGFHMLDGNPKVIDGIGFVGTIGWYDYSFRVDSELKMIVDKKEVALSQLKKSDYAMKEAEYEKNGQVCKVIWPDKKFVNLPCSDETFLLNLLIQLKKDVKKVTPESEKLVYVLHHVPFADNLVKSLNPSFLYTQAYMGSRRLGDFINDNFKQKDSVVIHGHSHLGSGKYQVDNIPCYNVAVNKENVHFTIIQMVK